MSESRDILKEEFHDEEYRRAYAEDFLNTSIATQIRVLREQRGLTQDDLAKQIGTKQAGISRLENVNHSAWKTDTLHKIARAFDVRLRITFETFGTLLDEAGEFSRKELERVSFADDPAFHEKVAASNKVQTSTNQAQDTISMTRSSLRIHARQKPTSFYSQNLELDFGQTIPNLVENINKNLTKHVVDSCGANKTLQDSRPLIHSSPSFELKIRIPQLNEGKNIDDRAA